MPIGLADTGRVLEGPDRERKKSECGSPQLELCTFQ